MDDSAPAAATRLARLDWRAVVALNLLLGTLLWLMDCTDYSWANSFADALFGLLVFTAACMSLSVARQRQRIVLSKKVSRAFDRLAKLPDSEPKAAAVTALTEAATRLLERFGAIA